MELEKIVKCGDCLELFGEIEESSIDLVYIDPPFFTQRSHKLKTKCGDKEFKFDDTWENSTSYQAFLKQRIEQARRVLKNTGSIFFHCDKSGSHLARGVMDEVFGEENFQSEIIWYFKRWSNSRKGLLGAHQNIFFYSKTSEFKFNQILQEYSPTTNVDQIMQKRSRDNRNKVVYATDTEGNVVTGGAKKGVPLSDVWEIPFLNPKAKERVGYPTQKPIALLKRIVEISTDEGDRVLDPFCGSGTTLVAANLANRNAIGFDISVDAVDLVNSRLESPVETNSSLMKNGIDSYLTHNEEALTALSGIEYTPVHRNSGIDGLLKSEMGGKPVFVRVQRNTETVLEAAESIKKASKGKGDCKLLVFATKHDLFPSSDISDVMVVPTTSYSVASLLNT